MIAYPVAEVFIPLARRANQRYHACSLAVPNACLFGVDVLDLQFPDSAWYVARKACDRVAFTRAVDSAALIDVLKAFMRTSLANHTVGKEMRLPANVITWLQ